MCDAIFNRIRSSTARDNCGLVRHSGRSKGRSLPAGIFIDQDDMIYVVDSRNQRVQVYQYIKYPEESSARRALGRDAAHP